MTNYNSVYGAPQKQTKTSRDMKEKIKNLTGNYLRIVKLTGHLKSTASCYNC